MLRLALVLLSLTSSLPLGAQPQIIKLQLSQATYPILQPERSDWVRLEIENDNVVIMHTTQVLDWFWGVYNWHDHPPTRLVFKPDTCETDSGTIAVQSKLDLLKVQLDSGQIKTEVYEAAKKQALDIFSEKLSNLTDCLVRGEKSLTLPKEVKAYQGIWTVDYIESNQLKSVSFKVPTPPGQKVTTPAQ